LQQRYELTFNKIRLFKGLRLGLAVPLKALTQLDHPMYSVEKKYPCHKYRGDTSGSILLYPEIVLYDRTQHFFDISRDPNYYQTTQQQKEEKYCKLIGTVD
jgi:hypothetical protein